MFKSLICDCLGDEGANSNDSSWSMECSTVVRVETLHISSPILAAKSPFFYKVAECFLYDTHGDLFMNVMIGDTFFLFLYAGVAIFKWYEGI